MKLSEMIVALNSLTWDLETGKHIRTRDREYYADLCAEVQQIIINIDRQRGIYTPPRPPRYPMG